MYEAKETFTLIPLPATWGIHNISMFTPVNAYEMELQMNDNGVVLLFWHTVSIMIQMIAFLETAFQIH